MGVLWLIVSMGGVLFGRARKIWSALAVVALVTLSACGGSDSPREDGGDSSFPRRLEGGGAPLQKTSYTVSMPSFDGAEIFFTVFQPELPANTPAPLVLHSHGWGLFGIRSFDTNPVTDVVFGDAPAAAAEKAWNEGYFVISFDQRGWGRSQGQVKVQDPDFEGRDVAAIIDWAVDHLSPHLARWQGDPVVGGLGLSYGGGFQTIGAAVDSRIDAIVPTATWYDLTYSLMPGGVPKSLWATVLVGSSVISGIADPFIYRALFEGLLLNELGEDSQRRLANNGLASFCEGRREDGRTAPKVDAFFVQGLHDQLFNANEAVWMAQCLDATGADTRLLLQRDGHIIPLLQQSGNQILFGVEFDVQCGDRRLNVPTMMFDFLNEKLRGVRPAQAIPKVCITQSTTSGVVLDAVPTGGSPFVAADQTVVTGLLPGAVLGLLQTLEPAVLQGLLAQLPGNTASLVEALVSGLRNPTEDFAAVIPELLNLLPPQLLNELLTFENFAPLLTAEQRTVVAGIPEVSLFVSGSDLAAPILYYGIGVRRMGGDVGLLHEQVMPNREGGLQEFPLAGVSVELQPGDTIGLLIMPFHPQFFSSFARVPTPVTVGGTVKLPILGP
ncbi:alpha/beta hydrolase [Sinimarinibacterium flocculans]|uniref:X-Pro dipeptidyl-peptidase-like protein n=1 Tax=Sinimarinibacterium flocculans TaxID=985250 RepID=A0A318E711_9GAMM|nr:CocE/NonD family hydrolase [Sinimarinibacterium flocculans]PXV64291.1 X-Pro dipeptidyl-peptidase-like protein [Sinimarinibacterium flocculans]